VIIRRRWLLMAAPMVLLLGLAACSQAAPQEQPTSAAQSGPANLFLAVDMVQGSTNLPKDQQPAKGCVLSSRFPRNSQVVWRARIYDPKTGDLMDDSALSKVEVRLANGQTIAMKYGPHPKNPPGEAYWTASWMVPKDNATGTLKYSITATSTDGRTGEFKPIDVASSLLTITDEVLPDQSS